MALDTPDKRAAALGAGLTPGIVLPIPDGGIDAGDRSQLTGLAAIEAAEPTSTAPARRFAVRFDATADEDRISALSKEASEDIPVLLDLYEISASRWYPNEVFDAAEACRPSIPNGLAYSASGGTSGAREPRWPKLLGATVTDGSITWTAIAASTTGLLEVTNPSATSVPTGLTITTPSVEEFRKLRATYQGGSAGGAYDVVWQFTIGGTTRIARHRVEVRRP
jgi:hypothetical protein